MTTFLPLDRVVPQGIIQGPIRFSVMLNDIQAVDSGRSTLVKFADDLTLLKCFSGKGIQDQTPQEVGNILSWAQNKHDDYNPY